MLVSHVALQLGPTSHSSGQEDIDESQRQRWLLRKALCSSIKKMTKPGQLGARWCRQLDPTWRLCDLSPSLKITLGEHRPKTLKGEPRRRACDMVTPASGRGYSLTPPPCLCLSLMSTHTLKQKQQQPKDRTNTALPPFEYLRDVWRCGSHPAS